MDNQNKYLVTIEFRYYKVSKYEDDYNTGDKTITIGVYDTFDEACIEGNKLMETLETRFKLHVFPSGSPAKRERFSKNGGAYRSKHTLITNGAYLKTPFQFFATITTLDYSDINTVLDIATSEANKYIDWKRSQQN